MKLFKEIPKDNGIGSNIQEVGEDELRAESQKHIAGKPHTHIFGPDKYAASGWYERKCVICGHIDYI